MKRKISDNFTVTAHTGCMGTKANSLQSISAGYENSADIVEFDLNFDKNGEPVLSHDEPEGGEVTLDEAFSFVSRYENLRVNVDVKSDRYLGKVKPLAEKYGIENRIFFTGIHDGFVESASETGVEYYLNVNVDAGKKKNEEYIRCLVEKVKNAGAVGINFNKKSASYELVRIFHDNGLLVSIWTVDRKMKMSRILSFAPDNITTRKPSSLRKIVSKRK